MERARATASTLAVIEGTRFATRPSTLTLVPRTGKRTSSRSFATRPTPDHPSPGEDRPRLDDRPGTCYTFADPNLAFRTVGGRARRPRAGHSGLIDFLIQLDDLVVPVELKAGAAGAMKSLHQFTFDKRLRLAVRVDRNPPTMQEMDVKTTQGNRVHYRLLNLPGYLLGRVVELAGECR